MDKRPSSSGLFGNAGIPLRIVLHPRHEPIQMHNHACTELVLVLGGTGLHITQLEKYAISAGDTFVLHDGEMHAYQNVSNLSLINVLCDLEELGLPSRDMREISGYQALFAIEPALRNRYSFRNHLQLNASELLKAQEMTLEIGQEIDDQRTGYRSMAIALLSQLITFVSRCYENIGKTGATEGLLGLSRALGHIESHYNEGIILDDLADIAGMSRSTFQRAFRRATGVAAVAYLNRFRIRKACELLAQSDYNISEVGSRSGFEDCNYFSRKFKKETGTTPRQYRIEAIKSDTAEKPQ